MEKDEVFVGFKAPFIYHDLHENLLANFLSGKKISLDQFHDFWYLYHNKYLSLLTDPYQKEISLAHKNNNAEYFARNFKIVDYCLAKNSLRAICSEAIIYNTFLPLPKLYLFTHGEYYECNLINPSYAINSHFANTLEFNFTKLRHNSLPKEIKNISLAGIYAVFKKIFRVSLSIKVGITIFLIKNYFYCILFQAQMCQQ